MSTQVDDDGPTEPKTSAGRGDAVRRRVGVRALIAVVACFAAIFWAWRTWWDQGHPLLAAARGLGAGDPARRVDAIHEVADLGFGHAGESIRLLIPALEDDDARVRAAAAGSLGLLGSNAIGMRTGADEVRSATTALLGMLKDPDARVRASVTTSLAVIATAATAHRPEGRNPTADQKASAPVLDVDAIAVALVNSLESPDVAVRQAVITGLGAMAAKLSGGPPPALIKALDDESAANRSVAATALANYRQGLDPAIPLLLRHLEDGEAEVREACGGALKRIQRGAVTPAVVPALIASLRLPDRFAREGLVTLLGRLKLDPRATVPALIAVLREPVDSDVKAGGPNVADGSYTGPAHAAARALAQVAPGTPQAGGAIAAFVEVVRSGPARRRGSAAEGLGAFGPAAVSAVPALIGLMQEAGSAKEPTTAGNAAARALAKIAPGTSAADEALAALIAALAAPGTTTRAGAVYALSAFGPRAAAAVPAIRDLEEKDPDLSVRREATAALEKIKPESK